MVTESVEMTQQPILDQIPDMAAVKIKFLKQASVHSCCVAVHILSHLLRSKLDSFFKQVLLGADNFNELRILILSPHLPAIVVMICYKIWRLDY